MREIIDPGPGTEGRYTAESRYLDNPLFYPFSAKTIRSVLWNATGPLGP